MDEYYSRLYSIEIKIMKADRNRPSHPSSIALGHYYLAKEVVQA
jgi:hypothetical protein